MATKPKKKSLCFISLPFALAILLLLFDAPNASSQNVHAGKGSAKKQQIRNKLFVFGDSYGDTGNWKKGTGVSWELPYGSTFPGKPTGRFSDGRILTDFIASYLRIRSPVPYEQRRSASGSPNNLKSGMNFAYGGTGVFNTDVSQPNMTTQIDLFQNVLESESTYSRQDLETSIALVTLGGNDYARFFSQQQQSQPDVQGFTTSVVEQLVSNLKRIHGLGVPKIAVTGLEPLGCLPAVTSSTAFRNCSEGINGVSALHNRMLEERVTELNKRQTAFSVLDLYGAFMEALRTPRRVTGGLRPCCEGVRGEFWCGSRDGNRSNYRVCGERDEAFFWDTVHPAQHGWQLVFLSLKSSIKLLRSPAV